MSFIRCTTLVAMFVAAVAVTVQAQTSATQDVTYSVSAINSVSTSGNPGALLISGTFAGDTDASTEPDAACPTSWCGWEMGRC